MVRAPCCDKMGLNRGPWTPEEDRVLISYIEKNGHGNWRALPKLAGLSRCGKSCRLRWTNYLRPDIKRGNFTREEEDTIIQLHEMLGNRWSTIASKLPGRTDNEIKNVWHTHLKKRLKQNLCDVPGFRSISSGKIKPEPSYSSTVPGLESSTSVAMTLPGLESSTSVAMSPQRALSDVTSTAETSVTTGEVNNIDTKKEDIVYPLDSLPLIDETFWSDPLLLDDCSGLRSDLSTYFNDGQMHSMDSQMEVSWNQNDSQVAGDGMDFWYDLFMGAGGAHELPEF